MAGGLAARRRRPRGARRGGAGWPTGPSGGRSACWPASARLRAWPPVVAGGCAARLAAVTGDGGVRADRRRDAPRGARLQPNCFPSGAPITSWRRSGPRTPSGRSSSWPITTPRIRPSSSTRRSPRPWARMPPGSSRTTTPARRSMWPVVAGPAIVAAGAALGSRGLTGLGTSVSAGSAAFMAHIGAGQVVPAPTTTAPAALPSSPRPGALREPAREHADPVPLHLRGGALRGHGPVHGAARARAAAPSGPSSSVSTSSGLRTCSCCAARAC